MSYNGSSEPQLSGVNILPTVPESLAESERHDEDGPPVSDLLAKTSMVAFDGVTITPCFVERLLAYLGVLSRQQQTSAVLSEEEKGNFSVISKYFKNIRNKRKAQNVLLPSEAECLESPLGLLYGLVWNPSDPSTAWPPVSPPLHASGQLSGRSLVVAAPEAPAAALSDPLSVLAAAASADTSFRDRMGIGMGRSLADIQHDIQSHQSDFETCGDRALLAHQDYLDKHAAAVLQWNLAHQRGYEAHEALKLARALTEELNQLQVEHFALLREFEERSERIRQCQRDDCEH